MREGNSLFAAWGRVRDSADDGQLALRELRGGRSWSFAEIQAEVDALPVLATGQWCFPTGFDVALIFETLRAWRDGAVLCPVERQSDAPDPAAFDSLPDRVVHVKLTSGSTGGPRLVLFDGDALAADARKIVSTMGLRSEWPNLGVISMAHSYGFSSLVLPLLLHGIPLVWLGDPLPGAVETALAVLPSGALGWTLPAVPAMWRAWQAGDTLAEKPVRLAISAGAPLPIELERTIHASTGFKIHNFYGSSECGGIAYDRFDSPRSSADLVGTAMDETTLSVNEEGCLEVAGDSVALGYLPMDDHGQLGGGIFRTSDLATIDERGEVRLAGRRDDLINVAGRKISPARIESILVRVPGIRHALVFGCPSPNPTRGDEIVAVVNLEPDEAETIGTAIRAMANQLAPHECPRHWWSCPELEPDVRGKLSRSQWRERFLQSRSDEVE